MSDRGVSLKRAVVDLLRTEKKFTTREAQEFAAAVFKAMADVMARNVRTHADGIGTFTVKQTPAREMYDPNTGEKVKVPKRWRVSFKPSAAIKKAINE
jgi:nucleoid DNA-binding protein